MNNVRKGFFLCLHSACLSRVAVKVAVQKYWVLPTRGGMAASRQDHLHLATSLSTASGRRATRIDLEKRLEKAGSGSFSGEFPSRVGYNECQARFEAIVQATGTMAPGLKWVKVSYSIHVQLKK
eukprot:scpid102813/ scgid4939/ 